MVLCNRRLCTAKHKADKRGDDVIYRRKQYDVTPEQLAKMNDFFRDYVLPIQLRHGARLVGRWIDEDGTEILAIWEYDSMERYREIEQLVSQDPMQKRAEAERRKLGPLCLRSREDFLEVNTG